MATLTLIGEPFPDLEAAVHAAAAVELTRAVAETAPRGCSARLLVAADHEAPMFDTARARSERLPLKAAMLPVLWRSGVTARPLDGELVHALTPLAALRARGEDDGSQSSVMVPHALSWLAPEAMGAGTARLYRSFIKRAVKHADVLVTPTHATAAVLQERFGGDLAVQVLPLAAPEAYRPSAGAAARRRELGLPERYLATTAGPGETGRLDWLFSALSRDASLPPLVVIAEAGADAGTAAEPGADAPAPAVVGAPLAVAAGGVDGAGPARPPAESAESAASARPAADPTAAAVPENLRGRVHVVHPRELRDIGAILSGAELLALPQALIGTGYEVLGALAAQVPVVHAECASTAELVLDAGVGVPDAESFARELGRITADPLERARLSVFAQDRSRGFSWAGTATALWELHANI